MVASEPNASRCHVIFSQVRDVMRLSHLRPSAFFNDADRIVEGESVEMRQIVVKDHPLQSLSIFTSPDKAIESKALAVAPRA